MITALCDAVLFTGEAMVENHALLIQDGKILDIAPAAKVPSGAQRISQGGRIVGPGLIDAQVNGGGNVQFNNSPSSDGCIAIAKAHQKHGTTRLLPTCMTDKVEVTQKAIGAVREARKACANILGIHLEGPHLSHEKRGVHQDSTLRVLGNADIKLYRREGDEVMLITLAPEAATAAQVKVLLQQGAVVSLGHSAALPAQIHAALEAGASGFTHLFNGMGGMTAREPGVSGVALDDRLSWCGIITDGHHVSDAMIRLALRAKPIGKMFLVSDAMAFVASEQPQDFALYGETLQLQGTRAVNKAGKLAGSGVTLLDCLRYCVEKVGVELDEAWRMASMYPAAFLGVDQKLGRLLPGFAADIAVLDPQLKLHAVYVEGQA